MLKGIYKIDRAPAVAFQGSVIKNYDGREIDTDLGHYHNNFELTLPILLTSIHLIDLFPSSTLHTTNHLLTSHVTCVSHREQPRMVHCTLVSTTRSVSVVVAVVDAWSLWMVVAVGDMGEASTSTSMHNWSWTVRPDCSIQPTTEGIHDRHIRQASRNRWKVSSLLRQVSAQLEQC